ncbi:MAG TPA: efflux RND transporter periplasmic adaptor subunit [Stellaceae bacterium]|nr:efflux RND transporter periplasmic adaptor subunit [Stellaceae bacterium]
MRISGFFTIVALIVVAAAGWFGYQAYSSNGKPAGAPATAAAAPAAPGGPPRGLPVPVKPVAKMTIPVYREFVGSTEAIRTVAIQAKITGYLMKRGAADGADVKQGDLLYKIDPRDYQAALDQAKAQVQKDVAALQYARATDARNGTLAKQGWVTADAHDQTTSNMNQGIAALAADQAAVQTAENNLAYTEIRAPFDGRISKSQVFEGNLINAAGTQLNTLVQIDPIYATFNPSERDFVEIEKYRAVGKIQADILLTNQTDPQYTGVLTFVDNTVDRTTGTISMRVTVDNPKHTLLPGQYVRVRLHLTDQPDTLLVPQTAIGANQLGQYVYIVGEGNKAQQQPITPGATYKDMISIVKGVKEGDSVIVGNLQKIGPGAPVTPTPAPGQSGS